MIRHAFESRELLVGSLGEFAELSPPSIPFAVLLAASPSSPTADDRGLIERLAVPNCREMCFAGGAAEPLHDLADEVIEARGLLDIVTTWLTNESAAEVGYYFVRVAGARPPLLVAAAGHELALAIALEDSATGRATSG